MNNFFYFWISWLVIGVCSFLFFRYNKNAGLKRFIFPFVLTFINLLFLYFVWTEMNSEGPFLYIFTFGVILIAVSNYRRTKFCSNCGATVYGGSIVSSPSECHECTSRLE